MVRPGEPARWPGGDVESCARPGGPAARSGRRAALARLRRVAVQEYRRLQARASRLYRIWWEGKPLPTLLTCPAPPPGRSGWPWTVEAPRFPQRCGWQPLAALTIVTTS